ncbi:MAG: HlyC/CorC family transporter [Bacteroidetes bacterium]|nr:HlyC/CorC family transporter [Bacteroidota bacterium]
MDYLLVIFSTILFIAFYSGIEIAYLSSNKFQIELDNKQGKLSARILSYFVKSPSKFICTVLVGMNIALVIYGTYMSQLLKPYIQEWLPFNYQSEFPILVIETIITTIFLLIAGEFLPKVLFSINPNQTLNFFSIIIWFSYIFLFPAVWLILQITHFVLKLLFKIDFSEETPEFGRIDLDNYITEINKNAGKSELKTEIKMFQNALDFESLKIRQCMIPRTEIISISETESIPVLKKKFTDTGVSKIMVYRQSPDNIIGFVHSSEIFKNPESIQSMVLPVSLFPETLPAKDLLSHFTENHRSVAVVVDEFGSTSGIVTVEDIMEEIFGEINDEHDIEDLVEGKISDNEFIFSGRLEIDYLNTKYHLNLPYNDSYKSLAGFILHQHENIPEPKEEISIPPFIITIQTLHQNRIDQVKMKVIKAEEKS